MRCANLRDMLIAPTTTRWNCRSGNACLDTTQITKTPVARSPPQERGVTSVLLKIGPFCPMSRFGPLQGLMNSTSASIKSSIWARTSFW